MQSEASRLITEAQEALDKVKKLADALERPRAIPAWFVELMEARMQANCYKLPQWRQCFSYDLLMKIPTGAFELEKALEKNSPDVPKLAADVANFAMMVADNWMRENP